MRISTFSFHQSALDAMLAQQAALARTQNQISTGRRLQTAADDPAAAVHVLELERTLAAAEQHRSNAINAKNRLQLEEATLDDATNVLQRVRELALRANSPILDNSTRSLLTAEIRSRLDEFLSMTNRQDVNGEYLFSGYAASSQPFARASGGAVVYQADAGERQQVIAPGQKVADGHSGDRVFVKIPEGNGAFIATFASANTGTGVLGPGTVVDRALWDRGAYSVNFTAPGSYEVRDSANALVNTGAYQSGSAITFRGISFALNGAPATGDQFTVRPAATESIFTTMDKLVTLTSTPTANAADQAKLNGGLSDVLQQLSQGIDSLLSVRAEVGSRLSAIDVADQARDAFGLENKRLLSELQDVDYADAVTRMNRELLALQAAQSSDTRLSQLSLFNYL
jgi:flagellar hook-associated protein 3 FlgL